MIAQPVFSVPPAALGDNRVSIVQLQLAYRLSFGHVCAYGAPVRFAGGELGDVDDANIGLTAWSAPIDPSFAGELARPSRGEVCGVRVASFEETEGVVGQ